MTFFHAHVRIPFVWTHYSLMLILLMSTYLNLFAPTAIKVCRFKHLKTKYKIKTKQKTTNFLLNQFLSAAKGNGRLHCWTARRSNQSILKEISPEYSLEGLMLKLKLQYFGHGDAKK